MGDTALIITDYAEFRHRFEEKAKEEGYNTHFGYVQYYDETKDNVNLLASTLLGVWTLAFWKRKKYSYQQEARFIFSPCKEGTDHIELDIGDISDISKIVDSRSLLSCLLYTSIRADHVNGRLLSRTEQAQRQSLITDVYNRQPTINSLTIGGRNAY